jgi:hypothetical protein
MALQEIVVRNRRCAVLKREQQSSPVTDELSKQFGGLRAQVNDTIGCICLQKSCPVGMPVGTPKDSGESPAMLVVFENLAAHLAKNPQLPARRRKPHELMALC